MNIVLDPIPLDARMGCSAPNSNGVRTATIRATAPVWATVRFDRVEQTPDRCASPALLRSAHAPRIAWLRVASITWSARSVSFHRNQVAPAERTPGHDTPSSDWRGTFHATTDDLRVATGD